ncbi:DUF1761 domain-containing protein [Novosphingobium bradum]|uniref:DUF1761 domain-containing protein n=1 Tax=Novosphingobium bradum TaxID=1737444 RepID=A0ABV7ISF7_9SPHN
MGPINWPAVVLSPVLMQAIALVWYGPLFGGLPPFALFQANMQPGAGPVRSALGGLILLALPALMIGHALARIGPETLALKPWLYWMQTGGIAAFFIVPALWLNHARLGQGRRVALVEAGYWLVSFLAMGTVFWALG